MAENKAPSTSVMSKKRYHEIEEALRVAIPDPVQHAEIMSRICEIMKYDPTKSMYTPEVKERSMKWRRKKAEELGVTTYVTSGMKAYYERSKEVKTA